LHFMYGGGTYRFREACRKKGLSRPAFSSPLWYVNLVLSGCRARRGWRGVTLSALLAGSQAATLAGMVFCSLARRATGAGPERGNPKRPVSR
jgi:hypothetical protein